MTTVDHDPAECVMIIAVLRHVNDGRGDAAYMDNEGWHRASFPDIADQLEAACAEVERLTGADISARISLQANQLLIAERDSLRQQLEAAQRWRGLSDGDRLALMAQCCPRCGALKEKGVTHRRPRTEPCCEATATEMVLAEMERPPRGLTESEYVSLLPGDKT